MNDRDAIGLLERMVRIRSFSMEEGEVAEFLVSTMRERGFDRAFVDDAGNAVGMVNSRRKAIGSEVAAETTSLFSIPQPPTSDPHSPIHAPKTIVLLGHMDTVPGDVPVRIEDGKLYGRGSVDAKGPLAAFIAATARMIEADDLPLNVVVIGCVEEEVPSSKGARFVVPRYAPDYCIVGEPSGWDAMTLGYKGFFRATLRLEQPSSHTAHPGPRAAEVACETWMRVRAAADRFNQGRERVFDQILPALTSIQSGSDGRTDWAELRANFRLPPGFNHEEAERWLRELTAGWRVEVIGSMSAWAGPRTTPLHRSIGRAIRAEGGDPRYLLKTGTADLNIVAPAWGCPSLAYGPGDAALDHTPDEHIVLDEYLRGIAVLRRTIDFLARADARSNVA